MDIAKKVPISVLVPTRNEEANITKCLDSIKWADEIFVVDSESTDHTVEIAKEYTSKVITFHWNGKWPRKKNWALGNLPISHEWVLIVDADEEVTQPFREEICSIVENGSGFSGFMVPFQYYFLGRLIKHSDPLWKCIFFKHRFARFEKIDLPEVTGYDVEVHEHPLVKGKVGRMKNPIIHHDFENLYHHFLKHNIYSDWEAQFRSYKTQRNKKEEVASKLLGSPIERRRFQKELFFKLPFGFRSLFYFIYSYFFRLGFLDGKPGFIYNLSKAFHWYMVDAKLYELILGLEKKPRASGKAESA